MKSAIVIWNRPALLAMILVAANACLLLGGLGANHVTSEEVRSIPAGLSHWETGSFALASDSPPLSRLIATLPILAMKHYAYYYDLKDTKIAIDTSLKEREENYGERIAGSNPRYLRLAWAARATNFLWWLAGAWVIRRWARELFGDGAALLALALWCFGPNVLAQEQVISPGLPAAVACLWATHQFRRYLGSPTWGNALAAGILLGIAQLADFAALVLFAIWPVLAIAHPTYARRGLPAAPAILGRAWQVLILLVASLWAINLGFAFQGSGTALGDYWFVSRALGAGPGSGGPPAGGELAGNRFRGTRISRLPVPVPADYLEGLDRRWHESWRAPSPTPDGLGATGSAGHPLALCGARIPLGASVMVVVALGLALFRRTALVPRQELLTLAMPGGAALAMTAFTGGFVPPELGIIMAAPYGTIMAGSLGARLGNGRRFLGWIVLAALLWVVLGSLASYPHPRGYLDPIAGWTGDVAAAMRYGPPEGGPDLLALKAWLAAHPEVRLRGIAIRHPIGPHAIGLRLPRPPINPGAGIAGDPSYTRRVGPEPGTYAIDLFHARRPEYAYFAKFACLARVGSSILIYRLGREEVGRVRAGLGLPTLVDGESERKSGGGKGIVFRNFVDSRGVEGHYALYVPPEYQADRPYPLIFFLHGYGDAGTAGRQYMAVGLPAELGSTPTDGFGFFVLMSQGHTGIWTEGDDARRALEQLALVQQEYRIDPKRISLTGISSGAAGIWDIAARDPDRWAAMVMVSPAPCNLALAPALARVPCWCFHNSHDQRVPARITRGMITALRAAGGMPRYTEFFGLDHDTWGRAYAMSELYDWLILQRRP